MRNLLHNRTARIVAIAVLAVAGPLILLTVLATTQVRHMATALRTREDEALRQCARSAARELAYRILQNEGEVIGFLDLESAESLVQSLSMAESAFPGITGFVLMRDGAFLYPPAGEAHTPDPRSAIREYGPSVFASLGADGVGRLSPQHAGREPAVSLHALELSGATGVVGICWGAAAVMAWARDVETAVLPARYALEVQDSGGRFLFGPSDTAVAPATNRAAHAAAIQRLPGEVFPWEVAVHPRDAAEIDRLVRRQVILYVGTLVFLAGVVAAGVWFIVRTSLKEVKLARLKADFAANISHELRTPLALIQAAGESLAHRPDLSKPQADRYVGIILKESRRLTDLVNAVLDFSRLEQKKTLYRLAPHDVGALANDFAQSYRAHIEEQGFVFSIQIADGALAANVDPAALHLVLTNLADNAVKFSAEHKEIAVSVRRLEGNIALRVQDRGIGIAPEEQRRIFESFYRVEGDMVKKTRGAGIGLALVRRIVEAHGGSIAVESTPGKGSMFTVLLPAAPPGAADDAAPAGV